MSARERETSGATTCLLARYVRSQAGDDGLREVHARAGLAVPIEALEDERRWFTYEDKIALFEAAAVVLDDPDVTRHMAEHALALQVGAGVRIVLRALGSPRIVVSNIAKACPKFSTVATMDVLELGRSEAVISYELRADKTPHRLDCLYNQGLISMIGPLFGMPPLDVGHSQCQVRGDERCIYTLRWNRRRLFGRSRARRAQVHDQARALAAQVEGLQSAAADLVSVDDVSVVLDRIVTRAAAAVSAPRHLLAITAPDGTMTVRSDGFANPADADRVAAEIVSGRYSTERVLVHPVASARRVYGVLAALYDEHAFFEYERSLLAAYARHAAAALDVAGALDEARRRSAESDALLHLATALAELSTPATVAEQVATAMHPVLDADVTVVWLVENEALTVRGLATARIDLHDQLLGTDLDAASDERVRTWLANPAPTIVERGTESPVIAELMIRLDAEAIVVVPIVRRGRLLGVAAAGFECAPPDPDGLLVRCGAVADQAAIALDNANLLARVTHQALHDDLTGLASRSHFDEEMERALSRAARDGGPVSLVFLDLDGFKSVNDSFDHLTGDWILREVARRLRSEVRAGDVVGRFGGDEFAIMLWGANPEHAMMVAERVRLAIAAPYPERPEIHVSASVGVATSIAGGGTYGDLVRAADLAMYEAKRAGRNLCIATPSI